ncbi:MAG TPA: pilus assembly protein N-terminal domain-containing protein [Rhizomicrobium sp.]|nr:pilus assembly protein N-terminal domain-containing protein [Rhizomicrobium sp.]
MTLFRLLGPIGMMAALGLGTAGNAAETAAAETEHVAVGGQYLIEAGATPTRVALGDAGIADVKLVGHQIRLVGLKAGATDLTVWSKDHPEGRTYNIVVGPNVTSLKTRLAARPALKDVQAVSTPAGVTLEGDVGSLEARQEAEAIAKSETGKEADDQLAVADRRMIAVEVRFAAVSTSTMKALGLNFQKLAGGFQFASDVPGSINSFQFSPGGGLTVNGGLPLSQAFNLLLNDAGSDMAGIISVLGSVNLAQVLADPTLLVRSGDEANFLAGGEIPIPVPQTGASNGAIAIQYRKFGIQLHVHATALNDKRIVIQVNPEVSELDYQNALTLQGFSVPAIRSRSTDTTIELGDGQSFVLAGLMFSTSSNVEEKVPGLGDLPIIGDFFKRSQSSREQQELIIVATPHLVSPMAPGAVPKLPGEAVAYAPSTADMMLNTRQLDRFVTQYGLAPP